MSNITGVAHGQDRSRILVAARRSVVIAALGAAALFGRALPAKFALALGPVALLGLIITVVLIALLHRAEFADGAQLKAPRLKVNANRVLVIRALLATLILIALFFAGVVPAKAAIIIGGLLLLTRRVKSRRIYAEIDWSLLLMFAGLFIIVAGAQHALLSPDTIAAVGGLHLDQVPCSAP